ncbi:MAG: cytochrome P450 [Actinomycetota bacterium]
MRTVATRPRLADALFGRVRWGNQFNGDFIVDPYGSQLAEAIADGPVTYHNVYQQWFVVSYEHARQLLSSDRTKASGQIETLLDVRPYSQMGERARFLFKTLLPLVDPPDHTRLRGLVNRAFTPRRVAAIEESVTTVANRLLDDLPTGGTIDVRNGFTVPLPVDVIAQLLGVPEHLWPEVRRVTDEIVKLLDPFLGFDPTEMDAAVDDLWAFYGDLAEQRRRHPEDDLISALVASGDDGDRLGDDELIAMIGTLMGAGYETTSGVMGAALLALDRYPEQRQLVLDNPDLWPNAVEELLRYDTPVKVVGRQATADIDIAGVTIPEGANVLISFMAAHRDESVWDDPWALRLDRPNPRPLSFGHGAHHCVGAALARMELRVGLRALLERYPEYRIAEGDIEWRQSMALRNQERLVLTA